MHTVSLILMGVAIGLILRTVLEYVICWIFNIPDPGRWE